MRRRRHSLVFCVVTSDDATSRRRASIYQASGCESDGVARGMNAQLRASNTWT